MSKIDKLKQMTQEEQLLNEYGNLDFEFEELYKYRASYINKDIGLRVVGTIDYRDSLYPKEKLRNIQELENFEFQWLPKKLK